MNDDNPILYGSDGWYDALTGERIDTARLGRENLQKQHDADETWEQAQADLASRTNRVRDKSRELDRLTAMLREIEYLIQDVDDDEGTEQDRMEEYLAMEKFYDKDCDDDDDPGAEDRVSQ